MALTTKRRKASGPWGYRVVYSDGRRTIAFKDGPKAQRFADATGGTLEGYDCEPLTGDWARLAELDRSYDRALELFVEQPAGWAGTTRKRNKKRSVLAKRHGELAARQMVPTVRDQAVREAERRLCAFLERHADDPGIAAIAAAIEEREQLQARLTAEAEARMDAAFADLAVGA